MKLQQELYKNMSVLWACDKEGTVLEQ